MVATQIQIADDPNPGLIGGVLHEGEWINVLERYIPPPPRRPSGAGSFSCSSGQWRGSIQATVDGETKVGVVYAKRFCDMLRKFSELPKPDGFREACLRRPSTYTRGAAMKCARELGTHTPAEWMAVQKKQRYRCRYCCARRKLTKDHALPISRGGSDSIDNIVGACRPCNTRKNDRTLAEYLRYRFEHA